ncbi:hypothetical protein CKO28_12955 [Rhodovibrio sodomensis]|uniref:Sulfotransferase n=1 Tax=Rhodovibrio sodomensis TaxID=1088 RepID=A0ABS1DEP8_9PROT|nr:sulfotransferase [Rhodovibrio sodomensis]MBK1668940.1 hypothetical protein [Rhodovibrio sodomensis]
MTRSNLETPTNVDQSDGGSGIFLFGMERSGTTLLSMIVGSHPDIAVPLATTGLWYDVANRLAPGNELRSETDLQQLVADILEHDRIQRWDCTLRVDDVLPFCRSNDYASVVEAFHKAYAYANRKTLWGNIDIATLDQLHIANRWFPNARFVHIYRDARDVALSNQTMPYGAGNLAECADAWSRRLTINLRMGLIIGSARYRAIAYEDLVNNPREVLENLCVFLGVPFSESMLAYSDAAEAKVPEDRRWLWPNLTGPLDRSATHRWRTSMGTTKRVVVERYAGRLLRELGYDTYDQPPRRLSAELLDLAYFLDRGGRSKRWLGKLGLRRASTLERRWQNRKNTRRS